MLTLQQRIYLVKCYGIGNISYRHAIELFNEKYPAVEISRQSLKKLIRKFDLTGDVKNLKKPKKTYNEADVATMLVMESVTEHPKTSLRNRSLEINISKSEIQRVLAANKFKPFKPKKIHILEEGDDKKRLDFCLDIGARIVEDRHFYKNIIFSDECTFNTNGIVSSQNCRFRAQDKPNFTLTTGSQKSKKVNVWCAITINRIIGPYFFQENVNQNSYLEMLNTYFWTEFEEENLEYRRKAYFQQDGCPAHSTLQVRNWLNRYFPQKWLGRCGPIQWPPRSPDLTACDYFLWGFLKEKVYKHNLEHNVEILKQKIREAVAEINQQMIYSVYSEFRRRLEKCVEVGVSC